MEEYRYKDGSMLRKGYTTGTCAALAARAAVMGLLSGSCPPRISLRVPAGITVSACTEEPESGTGVSGSRFFQCAVRKDAGDDPDVTDGLLIFCRAEFSETGTGEEAVTIRGGTGVGRVTRKGLDQPVGEAAINSVPRAMIRQAVEDLLGETGEERALILTISVPEGEKTAEKTFNPLLGIQGGISILGTTGIVEPMSEEALLETIRAQLQMLRAQGRSWIAAALGNMGAICAGEYLKHTTEGSTVICSNYIGRTIDMAAELGFSGLLLFGHLGKLVKLGNGIMNTHSREGDGRMDTMLSCALEAGAGLELLKRIRLANTSEEALEILSAAGLGEASMGILLKRIRFHLNRRTAGTMETGVFLFSQETGLIGKTEGADALADRISREQETTEGIR